MVSIVIATFNRPKLLKRAIASALMQDFTDIEIIVTDDGADDRASKVCAEFGDERIKFFKNTNHTKSPNGNKNNGFDKVNGEFVCLLDDDDELLSASAISECLVFLRSGYECVFADCLCEKDGVVLETVAGRSPYTSSGDMSRVDYHCGRINGEFFKIFSRKFIDDFRFDERSFGGENELYIRFFDSHVYYIKKPLYLYRIARDDSATKNATKHALSVAHAYLKTAMMTQQIAAVHAPQFLATQYKQAAYYSKMGGDYTMMLRCIFKSLRVKILPSTLIFLAISPLPNTLLSALSRIRVSIKKRFGL
ncbi:glycosyltransferase [Campylobacter sp. faydin G-24]|uniref:Glycosyltransferase n=1 Tax=Campylobacter anatolicus TaxID=2829105 RepID=A0ABS5HH29_9BACT|nr:glycosyltransferase [Campylobacter anatolicus]MBR8463438.1 glycosyltransferase [Campylobacter anatolicus]